MKAVEHQQKLIREELEAHIEDMIADFVADGINPTAAREQAEAAFGDLDQHVTETSAVEYGVQSWFARPLVIGVIGYIAVWFAMLVGIELTAPSALSGQLQVFFLWWVFVGITAIVLLFTHWIAEHLGYRTPHVLLVGMLLTILASLSITSVLDVDNFEGNVHAVIAGVIVYGIGAAVWKRITVNARRGILYAFGAVVTWSTLIEEPLFSFFGTARCLFLTPDNVELVGALASCEQVPLVGRATAPLILVMAFGIPYMLYFLTRYWASHAVQLSRKLVFTAGIVAMPIAPLIATDVNNYGELDVIPQKAVIFETYMDILGRSPEDKDYLFYGRTRAYENMDAVEEILYNSRERRLKINLLHLEYTGSSATKEEVDAYVASRKSIEVIRAELGNRENSLLEELESSVETSLEESPEN